MTITRYAPIFLRGLAAVLLAAVPHSFGALAGININETRIFYHENPADEDRAKQALDEIWTALGRAEIIMLPPVAYYEKFNLPTNAVLCGREADPGEVFEVARSLMSNGFDIYYVGPYLSNEIDSQRNSIDITSVGDMFFGRKNRPLTETDLENADFECGLDPKFAQGVRAPR